MWCQSETWSVRTLRLSADNHCIVFNESCLSELVFAEYYELTPIRWFLLYFYPKTDERKEKKIKNRTSLKKTRCLLNNKRNRFWRICNKVSCKCFFLHCADVVEKHVDSSHKIVQTGSFSTLLWRAWTFWGRGRTEGTRGAGRDLCWGTGPWARGRRDRRSGVRSRALEVVANAKVKVV